MKIFIIGATGFIGSALARKLLGKGHDIIGLARTAEKAGWLESNNINACIGDMEDPSALGPLIRNMDVVINAAFISDPAKGIDHTVQVEKKLVRTINDQLAADKLFIYTSGTGVLGDTGAQPADETFIPKPVPLNSWRLPIEMQTLKEHGGIVIRPGLVYDNDDAGKNSGPVLQLLGQDGLRHGHTFYIGNGMQKWSVIHLDDLCELYASVIEQGKRGNIYHAVSDEAITMEQLAQQAALYSGVDTEPVSLFAEQAETRVPIASLLGIDIIASNQKVKHALGWRSRHIMIGHNPTDEMKQ